MSRVNKVNYAYRRTIEFLSSGRIHLKSNVRVVHIKYTTHTDSSAGTRWFVAEEVPKLQYKNPYVQILINKNESPSPYINIFYGDGSTVHIDTDGITSDEILSRLEAIAAKRDEEVERERAKRAVNTANFDYLSAKHGGHFCICEIPGQAPCPGKVEVPKKEHTWHHKETESSE